MKRITSLLLMVMMGGAITSAQQREDPSWVKELARKKVVYQVPGMDAVRVNKNLVYKRVGNRALQMDVYSPRKRSAQLPAVLFIHGGRIPENLLTTPKDWTVYVSFGRLMAASGFVGVTFNHRFHTWESLSDAQSDVMDAIAFVRQHSIEFGIDADRITLWAISAGGIFLSQPLRDRPAYLSSIVAYYPELDLQNQRASAPTTISDNTLKDFSPVYFMETAADNSSFPAMFIARAGLDDATLNDGLDRFVRSALKRNVHLELFNHPSGHHGFDIEDNNARSREILKRTIEFLKSH